MNDYNNETMKLHSDREKVRESPGVYLGSATIEGCQHTFLEILANSIDEAKNGHGTVIETKLWKDGSISVLDYGRGIPMDYNKTEKKYNWEIAYCILGGGGKFENGKNAAYQAGTLGLHGMGSAAAQLSSDWFTVDSFRDNKHYHADFKDGNPLIGENGEVLQISKRKPNQKGTYQRWKPSDEVFIDTNITADYIKSVLKEQAIVTKEVTLIFDDEETGEHIEYRYANGIQDYIKEKTDNGMDLLGEPIYLEAQGQAVDKDGHTGKFSEPYDVLVQMAIGFSNKTQFTQYFHNSSNLIYGGSPEKALKAGLLAVLDNEIRTLNKYKAKEDKIKWSDIEEVLCFISNSFSERTIFEGQTKFAIDSPGVYQFMLNMFKNQFATWLTENRPMAEKICDLILANKRARESAENIRISTKKKLTGNIDITNKIKKFVDCREKDPKKRELFICEGDSAAGAIRQARDANYMAVMPIRGKILSTYKVDYSTIFKSDIIMDLIRLLGCGVQAKGKGLAKDIGEFNIDNLKYNKIIFLTDSDVDGFQIRVLLMTMIYRLCPELIKQGYIYIAETPLFEITHTYKGKEETFFAFNDQEKEKVVSKLPGKIKLQRSKGLGENSPEMMWDTTLNPATRKLVQVKWEDVKKMENCLELFMGPKVPPRRDYIERNGSKYLDELDLS